MKSRCLSARKPPSKQPFQPPLLFQPSCCHRSSQTAAAIPAEPPPFQPSSHHRSSQATTAVEPSLLSELPLSEPPPPSGLPLPTTEDDGVCTQMTPLSGPCSSFPFSYSDDAHIALRALASSTAAGAPTIQAHTRTSASSTPANFINHSIQWVPSSLPLSLSSPSSTQ